MRFGRITCAVDRVKLILELGQAIGWVKKKTKERRGKGEGNWIKISGKHSKFKIENRANKECL